MTAEKFWTWWLKVTMIMVMAGGFLLVALYNLGISDFLDRKIDRVFFEGENPADAVNRLRIWMISVAGAVMAGWGLMMLYIVNHPFRRKEKWAWRSIFYPILIWYLIDNTISAWYGVGINVIINTVLFLQVIAPLLFLRNQFFVRLNTVS
jgi:hypothetical protein